MRTSLAVNNIAAISPHLSRFTQWKAIEGYLVSETEFNSCAFSPKIQSMKNTKYLSF